MLLCYSFALEKMNEKRLQNWNCLLSLLAWSLQLSMARLFYSSCAWLDLCAIVAIVFYCWCCWCFGKPMLLMFWKANVVVLLECWCCCFWTHWFVWTHLYYSNVLVLFEHIDVADIFLHIGVDVVLECWCC